MLEIGEGDDDELVEDELDVIEDNGETDEEDEEVEDDREESDKESRSQDFDNIWKELFVASVFEQVLIVLEALVLKVGAVSDFSCSPALL